MYKLTRIKQTGTVPYGYEAYKLEEDGKLLYDSVVIEKVTKESTIYGGLFRRDSEVSVPTGEIKIYKHPPTCTLDSLFAIMSIPVSCTAIIEEIK